MAIRVVGAGREWLLTDVVGSGSEGVVYAVDQNPGLVAKLVPGPRDAASYLRRLQRLVRQGREPRTTRLLAGSPPRLAWPLETVATVRDGVPGYLMPHLYATHQPLEHLLSPVARREHLGTATWRTALCAAANLAGLIDDLHDEEYVVGDLKPDNLWVDPAGRVALADVDSLQFTDGGESFSCRVRTAGYTAPECVDSEALPDQASDSFVLAILLHQLLMDGLHPFHGHPADRSPYASYDDNMLRGRSRLTDRASVVVTAVAPPLDLLPLELLRLFRQAFDAEARRNPARRPSPAEWARQLRRELQPVRLAVCETTHEHWYSAERPWCPWCDQRRRLRRGPRGDAAHADTSGQGEEEQGEEEEERAPVDDRAGATGQRWGSHAGGGRERGVTR